MRGPARISDVRSDEEITMLSTKLALATAILSTLLHFGVQTNRGPLIDPDGNIILGADQGGGLDPDGLHTDAGSAMDPNGLHT
jgi:hypothetical protein